MKILCHRGYWKRESEKNTYHAIEQALHSGRGIESDLRDWKGELVISHNPPSGGEPLVEDILQMMEQYGDKYCFAMNIKADGLENMLLALLERYHIRNYFTFDMSIPQMLEYRKKNIRYFTRQSEYEKEPVLYENAAGIWMDAFETDAWITEELIRSHLEQGKEVCLVSPDLHQRPYEEFWNRFLQYKLDWKKVYLCTDLPDRAQSFFKKFIEENEYD